MRYVLVYDITDNPRRSRLAKFLLDYGDRVQKSVFEADLTAKTLQEVMDGAAKYIAAEDGFRVYPLCASCKGGVRSLGVRIEEGSNGLSIV